LTASTGIVAALSPGLLELEVGLDVGEIVGLGRDAVGAGVREGRSRGVVCGAAGHVRLAGPGRSGLEVARVGLDDGNALDRLGLAVLADHRLVELLADQRAADDDAVALDQRAVGLAGEDPLADARDEQRVDEAQKDGEDHHREESVEEVATHQ
jgi:hypothetical protein